MKPEECPGEDCPMCGGEVCMLCGAGSWNNDPNRAECTHGPVERHTERSTGDNCS